MENKMPLPAERARYDETMVDVTQEYVATTLSSAAALLAERYEYEERDLYDAEFIAASFSAMQDRPLRDGRTMSYGFSVTPTIENGSNTLSLAYQLNHIESSHPVDFDTLPREARVAFQAMLYQALEEGEEVEFTEAFIDALDSEVVDESYACLPCVAVTNYVYDCDESSLRIIKAVRTSYTIGGSTVFSCEGGGYIDDPDVGEQYQQVYMDMGVENQDAIDFLTFDDEIGEITHEDIERMNEILHWNGLDT